MRALSQAEEGRQPAECVLSRGFNKAYGSVEGFYVGIVSWMAHRVGLMAARVLRCHRVAGWRFIQQPTGFLPTEDQGYCIIATKLPDGAAQPRARSRRQDQRHCIERAGVAGWVTVGGLSILDGATLSTALTTFVPYKDWSERGAELSQDHIVASLRRSSQIEEAAIFVLIPPPIRGLGQSGGFQMMIEDRANLGLGELDKATQELIRAASSQSGLVGLASISARGAHSSTSTSTAPRRVAGDPAERRVLHAAGLSGLVLRQPVQQVQSGVPGLRPGGLAVPLQPEDIKNLYVRNERGEVVPLGTLIRRPTLSSELITRYNLYPAAAVRRRGARLQLRPGAEPDGAGGGEHAAGGHVLRMDGDRLPGEADRQPGVLHLRAVSDPGVSRPGRAVRELDQPGRGHPDGADGARGACCWR